VSDTIAGRLAHVRARLARAAERAGRDASDVRLVAVSKKQPASAIVEAHAAGQRDFGENYVQELASKAISLEALEGIRWHAIGALQRNKAKDVVRVAHVIHTIDREELALEVAKRAAAIGRVIDVLVEVDLAGEDQKAGCAPDDAPALVAACTAAGLVVVGLMAIPPASDDPEATRPHFAHLRALRDDLLQRGHATVRELSMGMSHDFEVAIEEGATLVRVGTAIFGART
jgi:pyridoxal phosphate enzyme (YggS family)